MRRENLGKKRKITCLWGKETNATNRSLKRKHQKMWAGENYGKKRKGED